ncbi:hypothetical protein [Companilactobacillus ginsenosidimutans]|uniref:AbrB family transcriptional regulator n=1 Tax=Companilactobacillus ginsenosidimutans TaxID=1007676 RepID=A0A0H4R1S2_9LACO|nr:hypothetical protein [Companilactobacillus ginsenosidimutans]AKP67685.1 hypothetical protein ABM34_09200 [Companilactobacillus ginsenosidimutans]
MGKILGTYKAKMSGNSLSIAIPKDSGIKENQELMVIQEKNGDLLYSTSHKNPWNGMKPYDFKKDVEDFEFDLDSKAKGREKM